MKQVPFNFLISLFHVTGPRDHRLARTGLTQSLTHDTDYVLSTFPLALGWAPGVAMMNQHIWVLPSQSLQAWDQGAYGGSSVLRR